MKTCESCGDSFACGARDKTPTCWCFDLPVAKAIPNAFTNCLCPKCLAKFTQDSTGITEGLDFYYDENGMFVFTEAYHVKRGHCCESGCKHCPYGFKKR